MLLPEYLQDSVKVIDDYSKTGFIVTSEVRIDFKDGKDWRDKIYYSIY